MEFMLFTNKADLASVAWKAGVGRIIVDLERRDKRRRQHGYHLEYNRQGAEDVARIKATVPVPVMCRVNPIHKNSPREIDAVLVSGADVVMLPMFRRADEVDRFLQLVAGRSRTSLLFETREAVALAGGLARRPFDEVYVGLNDLAISCGVRFCYELLADGVVDRLRDRFPGKPFGFGGLTVLEGGRPLPTRLILKEQARLKCTQVILRRSFKRDVRGRDMAEELRRLNGYYRRCARRSARQTEADRRTAAEKIEEIARTRTA